LRADNGEFLEGRYEEFDLADLDEEFEYEYEGFDVDSLEESTESGTVDSVDIKRIE
jgi:hypothetical protein